MQIPKSLFFPSVVITFFIGCTNPVKVEDQRVVSEITERELNTISNTRIFFGHQSVGENILSGLEGIEGFDLPVIDIHSEEIPDGPALLHTAIGRNNHADEKIFDFARAMRSGYAEKIDIAFMKFCYVDANHGLTAEEIFTQYLTEMEALEADYTSVKFIYLTMPLTTPQFGVKNLVKKILGMPIYGREENMERHRFNEMLRKAKQNTGRLFDIARIESTKPDGSRHTHTTDDLTYEVLVPEYTSDGGHLNDIGRKIVANSLIEFLALLQN